MKRAEVIISPGKLRRSAEARLRQHSSKHFSKKEYHNSEANAQRLLHELQVHQVELEMQNSALQEARDRIETLLEKYTDLYDFAPVGYFSVDEKGRIMEVNLTGATMLGLERSRLLGLPLPRFIASSSQRSFFTFLTQVFAKPGNHVFEAELRKEDGALFWANLHGIPAISSSDSSKLCRLAVSDISALKQAEQAQSRVAALAAVNRELKGEIVRRQRVEKALVNSHKHQKELLVESSRMQEQLRSLSHRILQAQEEERKRISRELHDEITQTLIGINVHLENLARESQVNPRGLRKKIIGTQRLVEKSVTIVHKFARELRPTALDDLGLIAALHSLMKDFMKRTGIRVHFTTFAFGQIDELDNVTRTVFYRVTQEALSNIARHAQATRVDLCIQKLPGALLMEIRDDGTGFDVEQVLHARRNKRLGLLGMRERVEMVGGEFRVRSALGQGTAIRTQIPFVSNSARARKLPAANPKTQQK